MKMLEKTDSLIRKGLRVRLVDLWAMMVTAGVIWSAQARRSFGSGLLMVNDSWVQILKRFFYEMAQIARGYWSGEGGVLRDMERIECSDASEHSRWRCLQAPSFVGIFTILLHGQVLASPFAEPVRYPSAPGTLLGIVQVNGQAVESGAVLGFYQGTELRGRFDEYG